jgi:CheY-like chemotaxis protein
MERMDSKLLILIAEDNEDDAFIIQHVIKKAALPNPTHICPDGLEAVRYLQGEGEYSDRERHPFPRMLILDLKMPKMTGFEVLRWIRAHPDCAVIPTIILTASNEPSDIAEAYRLGANAYLVKPSAPMEGLEQALRRLNEFWSMCALPELPAKC